MDRRETPSNGRVAHVSLKGTVEAERFTEGELREVLPGLVALRTAPDGGRERELLMGERFRVLEEVEGWAFGMAERDGFVGYIPSVDLGAVGPVDHVVSAPRTYAKGHPDLKLYEPAVRLSFGSRIQVRDEEGDWSEIRRSGGWLWMPRVHLRPVDAFHRDPVTVARLFLGTPYLWGGNSAFGIDCSGLVQAAMLACGVPCPGDSDQQAARLGEEVGAEEPRRRGDLWFWEGHVGILSEPDTLLHANAHHMAVVEEPVEEVVARIAAKEGLGVLCRRRVQMAIR